MRKKELWYFYFGLASIFIVIGFFWLFSYYASFPIYIKSALNESIHSNSTTLVVEKPPFPWVALFLVIFGTATFLISKYFYDKEGYHVKRTRKHG
ncbi:MAG: hypothetical protein J7K73_03610 [Nanoarchaeota archaeon]|nr:hypothetical protein [Nanoarchaeota archaeon]